ncbi:MAG: LysR substrate-binding domain-containing protein [Bacteroidota bacterium]
MNLQQLEYIIAVDTHRHFGRAARACHVTQPTLSMMIQKLEDELGVKIFDRSKQPVIPTETGSLLLDQARRVLREAGELTEIVQRQKGVVEGKLQIGIIPTLAPYLVPLFIRSFLRSYPGVRLKIAELTTEQIVADMQKGKLDVGILATPLDNKAIQEHPLFYEPFWVYSSHSYEKQFLLPSDIDPNELWLLEEGHCMRSQILNLCELRKQSNPFLQYENGSIETFKRLVDQDRGITILPELATRSLSEEQRSNLLPFEPPVPVREISLVTHRNFIKKQLIEALREKILNSLPENLRRREEETQRTIGIKRV